MFPYFFIVDTSTDEILSVVQRNVEPQSVGGIYFVNADRISLTFYYRLVEVQDVVYIGDVIKFNTNFGSQPDAGV